MAIRLSLILFFLLSTVSCIGCGVLYTNVVKPHSTDFNNTQIGSKHCTINDHKIKEPITGYSMSAEWITKEIAGAIKEAGIEKINYTEMKTFSVFFGAYKCKTLIVYGD